MVVSNILYFHPWGNEPIWLIFFKWVETTNQISHQGYSLSPPEIWGQKWWFLDPPGREVVAHEAMYDSWSRFGTRGTQPRSPPNGGFSQRMARNILWVKDFFWKNCTRMIEKPYQWWWLNSESFQCFWRCMMCNWVNHMKWNTIHRTSSCPRREGSEGQVEVYDFRSQTTQWKFCMIH